MPDQLPQKHVVIGFLPPLGVPIYFNEYLPAGKWYWNPVDHGRSIVAGLGTDFISAIFEANLTDEDKEFLRDVKVKTC